MKNNRSGYVKIAKALKNNENIEYVGVIVGTVVGVNPLKISIYGGKAFITEENMYICKNVTTYTEEITINGTIAAITHTGVIVGDKVALIATEDNQNFFVIDKVV